MNELADLDLSADPLEEAVGPMVNECSRECAGLPCATQNCWYCY